VKPLKITFYVDRNLKMSHVKDHGLSEASIFSFFEQGRYFTFERKDKVLESFGIAVLENEIEIVLKVVYRKISKDHLFVITAWEIDDKVEADLIMKELDSWENQ